MKDVMDPYSNSNSIPMVEPPQQTEISKKMMLLGGGLILAIILALVMLLSSGGGEDIETDLQRLSLQLTNLSTVTDEATKNITNQDLSRINGDAKLVTATATAQFTALSTELKLTKPKKELITAETDTESQQKIDDAAVAGTFNRVYPSVLSEKMTDTSLLMQRIFKNTKNPKLKDFLQKTYRDFKDISKQLDNFET